MCRTLQWPKLHRLKMLGEHNVHGIHVLDGLVAYQCRIRRAGVYSVAEQRSVHVADCASLCRTTDTACRKWCGLVSDIVPINGLTKHRLIWTILSTTCGDIQPASTSDNVEYNTGRAAGCRSCIHFSIAIRHTDLPGSSITLRPTLINVVQFCVINHAATNCQ